MADKYVIDANILFSSLISGKVFYNRLFEKCTFYTTDFALRELQTYQTVILKKTKLDKEKFKEFTLFAFSHITVVPELLISPHSRQTGYDLCKDIDEKDTVYASLAAELELPLITRDKPLYEGLINKGFTNVIMFDELLRTLDI